MSMNDLIIIWISGVTIMFGVCWLLFCWFHKPEPDELWSNYTATNDCTTENATFESIKKSMDEAKAEMKKFEPLIDVFVVTDKVRLELTNHMLEKKPEFGAMEVLKGFYDPFNGIPLESFATEEAARYRAWVLKQHSMNVGLVVG